MTQHSSSQYVFRWLASRIFLLCAGPLLLLALVSGKSLVTLYGSDALNLLRNNMRGIVAQFGMLDETHKESRLQVLEQSLRIQFPLGSWTVTEAGGGHVLISDAPSAQNKAPQSIEQFRFAQAGADSAANSNTYDVTYDATGVATGVATGNAAGWNSGDFFASIPVVEVVPSVPFPDDLVWMAVKISREYTLTVWHRYGALFPDMGLAWGMVGVVAFALLAMGFYNSLVFSSYVQERFAKESALRRKLEQKVIEANRLSAMSTMVAGIAHEINTPVSVMTEEAGWVQDLLADQEVNENSEKRDARDADIARSMTTIRTQGERCREITHNLLRMARKGVADSAPVDINAIAEDVVSLSRHRAGALSVLLVTDTQATVPALAASAHVQQILLNLMSNALDALEDVPVQDRERQVTVRTEDGEGVVMLSVADTGNGMPYAAKRRIFEPFFTTKPAGKGTGLGLAISYALARRNNGHLSVESAQGEGTTFTLTLPAVEAQPRFSSGDENVGGTA